MSASPALHVTASRGFHQASEHLLPIFLASLDGVGLRRGVGGERTPSDLARRPASQHEQVEGICGEGSPSQQRELGRIRSNCDLGETLNLFLSDVPTSKKGVRTPTSPHPRNEL